MARLKYLRPEGEVTGTELLAILCQSLFNGQRPLDPLDDAYGDWDPID